MQKLILPVNKACVTASYKAQAYRTRFGFVHYGYDLISFAGDATVYAQGDGIVEAVGKDSTVGNTIIVIYKDVLNHRTGSCADVVARYFHLNKIAVSKGQAVNRDTVLGLYGNTGKYSTGAHLHLEFDSDTAWPLHSKTVGRSGTLICAAATDTSIDPMDLLHVKATPPDCQAIRTDKSCYNGMPYADPAILHLPEADG